ncbi:MAG TPA: TauD/TfdA family dioxygenase [Novosphingobium sp.]|nr:TauD/TfdA family dioxygenase [Novosphingobium sp.]
MPYNLGKYGRIRVEPVTGAIGAEIAGVDLSCIDDAAFAEIEQAFHDHAAIFFRDQQLDATSLAAFVERFAPLISPTGEAGQGEELVGRMHRAADVPSSTRNLGDRWHADQGSREQPNMGAALYCLEAPAYGGDTLFASLCAAYEGLSPALRTICDPLIALHSPPLHRRAVVARTRPPGDKGPLGIGDALPDPETHRVEHPLVCTHPATGRPILYVTGDHMVGIKGMSDAEARPLIDYLNGFVSRPEFTCRFRWKKGSLAIWDNRCTQHYAVNDYAGFARTMLRAEMAGTRPYGPAVILEPETPAEG